MKREKEAREWDRNEKIMLDEFVNHEKIHF